MSLEKLVLPIYTSDTMHRQAFTLIELLVVIAIIGILSTLVVTQLGASQIKARNATAQSDIAEMTKSVEAFRIDDTASGKVVSNTSAGIDTLNGTSGTLPQLFTGTQDTTAATYAAAVLKTPSSSYTYRYYASGAPTGSGRQLVQAAPSQPEYAICSTLVNALTPFYCSSETAGPEQSSGDLVATATGIVGWWQLEGSGTSTMAADASGNGNTGTLTNFTFDGTTNGWTGGKFGKSLLFDGSSDYIAIPYSGALNPVSAVTVSTWVNESSAGRYSRFVDNTYDTSYTLSNDGSGSGYAWQLRGIDGSNPQVVSSSGFSLNQWHHIVGIFDGSAKYMRLYVDGQQVASQGTTFAQIGTSSSQLWLGRESGGGHNSPLSGMLDDVRIYNRALSTSEIQQLYQGTL